MIDYSPILLTWKKIYGWEAHLISFSKTSSTVLYLLVESTVRRSLQVRRLHRDGEADQQYFFSISNCSNSLGGLTIDYYHARDQRDPLAFQG